MRSESSEGATSPGGGESDQIFDPNSDGTIRIPLRLPPGSERPFSAEDIILHDGDIVYIAGREGEIYYTGGLLPAAELPLPRDYDLDVVEAVMRISGPLLNGGITSNNLSGNIVQGGLGSPSPSLLTVIRQTEDGRYVHIRVDLNLALKDPRENLIIQTGDKLILQETPGEAFARYVSGIIDITMGFQLFRRNQGVGNASVRLP